MNENELLKRAKKRVKAKKDFYAHLGSYIGTMLFLCFINFMTSPGYWWVIWPAAGWGFGLISHYFSVFGFFGIQGDNWEEKELQKEMDRLRQKEGYPPEEEPLDLDERLDLREKIKTERNYDDEELV